MTPAWAAALAVVLAAGAWAAGWFTRAGALVGGAIAWVVLTGAGFGGVALLALFVVSGSVLRYSRPEGRARRRRALTGRMRAPQAEPGLSARDIRSGSGSHSPRRAAQVVANGWTAALGAALVPAAPDAGWAVLAGGLAAAQADTWATEVGLWSGRVPLLVSTGARVPPGTSGGVTWTGTAAGVAGASLVGAGVRALGYDVRLAMAVAAAGAAGMLLDSVLGAMLQATYQCAACGASSDDSRHCGVPGRLACGQRWMTNDAVNAVATGVGAAIAAAAVLP